MVAKQLALLVLLFTLSDIEFFRLPQISRLISVYHQVGVVIHRFLFGVDGEVGHVVVVMSIVSSCRKNCRLSGSLVWIHT